MEPFIILRTRAQGRCRRSGEKSCEVGLVLLAWDHKLCRGVLAASVLADPEKKTNDEE